MQIDVFTLVAEVFNFLLLVFLLQRFLYRPILRIMDERETAIVNRLKEAEEKHEEAAREKQTYQEKVREIDQQREKFLDEAKEESKRQREQMIETAREEVDSLQRKWHEAVEFERESFLQDLRQEVGAEIVKTARAVLRDMANQDLEDQVVTVFIERLSQIDAEEQKRLTEAATADDQTLHIESAFKLSDEARQQLEEVLRPYTGQKKLHYDVDNRLLCGVRVYTTNYEIAWTFDYYIGTLQDQFQKFLEENLQEVTDEQGEQHAEEHPEEHADSV